MGGVDLFIYYQLKDVMWLKSENNMCNKIKNSRQSNLILKINFEK
jgi:hypothetical protein